MKKLKWWMSCHVFYWKIFENNKYKMYNFGLSQGFEPLSSYWSARCANDELINYITKNVNKL